MRGTVKLGAPVRVVDGGFAGMHGVVLAIEPRWVLVRASDGVWPFPRDVWVHPHHCLPATAPDPTEGLEPAPF